jgi:hypothetical protein
MPEWDEQGNPIQEWDEQGAPVGASDKPKNPFTALRGSKIEAQPGLLSRVGEQTKQFFQELPLVGMRGFNLVQDIARGNKPWDPALDQERASREKWLNDMLGGAKEGEPEQRTGRILARMAPQVAIGAATGGMSLPAQAAIQGGAQAFQSISEGATPEQALAGGGIAALAPGVGSLVNKGVSLVKAPFKGSVDQAARAAAKRQAIDLPAGALTNSSRARGLEQIASRMLGGSQIENRGLQALDDIGSDAGLMSAGADETVAGDLVARDYAAKRAALQATKNAEYGKVGDLTGIDAVPEGTLAEIDRLLKQGTLDPDTLENLRKLRKAIAPKEPEIPEQVQQLLDQYKGPQYAQLRQRIIEEATANGEIGVPEPRSVADLMSQQAGIEYGGPNAMRDAGLGNKLRDSLNKDYTGVLEDAAPQQAAQLGVAKKAYGEYADLSQSNLGKTVSSNAERGTVDKIPTNLLRSTSSRADLERLMKVASPEAQDELRSVLLKQIVGDGKSLTPKAIERALKANKNADVVLTSDQIQRLRDLSTLRQAMAKTTIGSPTTPLLQARKYIATPARAALAGSLSGLAGIGLELGSEAAIAKFLGSKAGQKWLLEGFAPATVPGRFAQAGVTAASRVPSELQMDERKRRLDTLLAGR